jgi:hypothetical protein
LLQRISSQQSEKVFFFLAERKKKYFIVFLCTTVRLLRGFGAADVLFCRKLSPRKKTILMQSFHQPTIRVFSPSDSGLPDFSCSKVPERGEIYKMAIKYFQWV